MIRLLISCALAAAAAPESFPEPIRPFLSAKAKDGSKVLGDADLEKLAKLPQHTRDLMGAAADGMILGSANHLHILLFHEVHHHARALCAYADAAEPHAIARRDETSAPEHMPRNNRKSSRGGCSFYESTS